MSTQSITIEKNPTLEQSEDYYLLRRKGIEFIEQMGSRWWTDYNSHDPGITLLEALCYAITDLGFRTGWNIRDLLAEPPGSKATPDRQAFFTARDILTVNPLTVNDFRRILIDLEKVSNAWLICKKCACEVQLYADCEHDRLAYEHPKTQKNIVKVAPLGTYDVLLEFEFDPELGDLNDRKIAHTFIFETLSLERYAVTAEFRFPDWDAAAWGLPTDYVDENGSVTRTVKTVKLDVSLARTGEVQTLTQEEELRRWRKWSRVFFANIEIEFDDVSVPAIRLQDVPLRLFGSTEARQAFKDDWDFDAFTGDELAAGVAELFFKKMATVERAMTGVKERLHDHRNLCEDFCCISRVCVEDVAVCADVEVTPDADIERVLANVLFEIEQYFNPRIKFYTLQELLDEGMPVDEIFEGPRLSHGFVKKEDLEAAQLKSQLRTSDIINRLVEIEGVIAVKSLLLTRYDQNGQEVKGVADIGPGLDKDKISAAWTLEISDRCQPRLYVDNSRFIFYKNDLPFIARPSEVQDTLSLLRGQDERLKIRNLTTEELDLPVPAGEFRSPKDYYPVQYSFPLTYGIGYEGVKEPATEKRRAQARQLKAYLLFFEQLLANYLAQLANVRNLFSLDDTQLHTYFFQNLRDETLIRGVTELLKPELDDVQLQQLAESEPERLDRRNRFLDHLMARFAESFSDYALMLYSIGKELKPVAQAALINRKIAFLENYPLLSRERARSFNYKKMPQTPENQAVLRKRIALQLGLKPEMEERILIVEHLLLRPKFSGDALMEVCLDKDCATCGEEDPYSFQLTVVMPGWADPFDENIELRRFADRSIKLETPSHLLCKICWVSNLDYGEGWEKNLIRPLSKFLIAEGKNANDEVPSEASAQHGAENFRSAAQAVFVPWLETGEFKSLTEDEIRAALDTLFKDKLTPLDGIYDGVSNYDVIGDKIFEMLTRHFTRIAIEDRWFHYDRFKKAWEEWLLVNADFDWCNEQVIRKIELGLAGLGIVPKKPKTLRQLACELAGWFGMTFSEEMEKNVRTEKAISNRKQEVRRIFNRATKQKNITQFGIPEAQKEPLRELFADLYPPYFNVTRKLWEVVLLLAKLQSAYPPATLHDCDDSNDENPVRLGSTMLGG